MSRLMQQVRDQVFDKKVESWSKVKRVANPHELVENLVANLVENQARTSCAARSPPQYATAPP